MCATEKQLIKVLTTESLALIVDFVSGLLTQARELLSLLFFVFFFGGCRSASLACQVSGRRGRLKINEGFQG